MQVKTMGRSHAPSGRRLPAVEARAPGDQREPVQPKAAAPPWIKRAGVVGVGCMLAWLAPAVLAGQGRGAGAGAGAAQRQRAGQMGGGAQSGAGQAATAPARRAMNSNRNAADLLNAINTGEMATARLMAGKSTNPAVLRYARRLQTQRRSSQEELRSIATRNSYALAPLGAMERENRQLQQRLRQQSGSQADRSYVQAQVQEHRRAIAELQRAEPAITDPRLRTLARQELTRLRANLREAEQLQTQLGK